MPIEGRRIKLNLLLFVTEAVVVDPVGVIGIFSLLDRRLRLAENMFIMRLGVLAKVLLRLVLFESVTSLSTGRGVREFLGVASELDEPLLALLCKEFIFVGI